MEATLTPSGRLGTVKVPAPRPRLSLDVARTHGLAQVGQSSEVKAWKRSNEDHFARSLYDLEAHERGQGPRLFGALWARVLRAGGDVDLGLVSARVVTNAGVAFIVDAFQNLTELETMKYHAIGTATAAEATTDTALGTEATTQYTTSNTRPAGNLAEAATNTFETVATVTVKASIAVTEHGIFNVAAAGSGVLLDRSVFSVINLASGEGIQFTYDLTIPAGG